MTTILVVDDAAMDRAIAGGLLQQDPDSRILFAVDGEDAFKSLEAHQPDIVVTDLVMPVMDGLQLVERMKKSYPLTPVIIMTAVGSEETAVKALKSGAASYVTKKRLAEDLLETVKLVLRASDENRNVSRLLVHRTKTAHFRFELENDLSLLAVVVTYLQQTMQSMGLFDEAERLRIGVALEEVLLNAMFHGNLELDSSLREDDSQKYHELARKRSKELPFCDRKIDIEANLSRSMVQFTVRDQGKGFNPKQLPDPTDPANINRVSGRGLLLMYTFMDEVTFNSTANEVCMIKKTKRAD